MKLSHACVLVLGQFGKISINVLRGHWKRKEESNENVVIVQPAHYNETLNVKCPPSLNQDYLKSRAMSTGQDLNCLNSVLY